MARYTIVEKVDLLKKFLEYPEHIWLLVSFECRLVCVIKKGNIDVRFCALT